MKIRKMFHTIDTHTGGAPTRTIVGGIPFIPGGTMKEKMKYMMDNRDDVRLLLTREPRGNEVMSGTIITEPCDKAADIGVLYFEGGWMPMCGHDTIGVCTALVEAGIVEVNEPITKLTLDTASGLVNVEIRVSNNKATSVSFENAPAFVLKKDCLVKTKEFGEIKVDISYGGNIYAILPASYINIELIPENSRKIIEAGNLIKDYINNSIKVEHPHMSFINKVTHVEFYEKSPNPKADFRNVVVIPPGAIDRSPCGTGSSAKLALMYSKGEIEIGEEIVQESLIGSLFHCKIVDKAEVSGLDAVIPEIRGQAWVTGINCFVVDPDDPFPTGFSL